MPSTSISNLIQQIESADENQQGLVDWVGYLKPALIDMAESLGARGIISFTSTSQMSQAGGADGGFAIAPNNNNELILYKFFPNIDLTVVGGVVSTVAGQWRPVFPIATPTPIVLPIVFALGASLNVVTGDTFKDIILPTPIPSVGYGISITPTNDYAATLQRTIGFFVTNLTPSGFRISFSSAATSNGTFGAIITVIEEL